MPGKVDNIIPDLFFGLVVKGLVGKPKRLRYGPDLVGALQRIPIKYKNSAASFVVIPIH